MKVKAHMNAARSPKRFVAQLSQHLNDTGMITSFTAPPYMPEEEAQASALADQIHNELRKAGTKAESRVATLAVVKAYQMQVYGIIKFIEQGEEARKRAATNRTMIDQINEAGEDVWKKPAQVQNFPGSAQPVESTDQDLTNPEQNTSPTFVESAPEPSEPLTPGPNPEPASEPTCIPQASPSAECVSSEQAKTD